MLKSSRLALRDRAGRPITITELPALVADRHARDALRALGESPDGGVVALTFLHMPRLLKMGAEAIDLLAPFVQADHEPAGWGGVLAVQQAALALHTSFLIGRPKIEFPVVMQAEAIRRGAGEDGVHFCSPPLAAVLHSGRASYRELETVLSTEDAYNILELLNVEAIRDWRAHQLTKSP